MKKITSTFCLTAFVISYLSPTIGSAIDPATSGRIIDNFKAQQEEILFESSPVEITDANKILEQEYAMKGLESLKARLATMQSAYESKKEAITETRITLEGALADLAESIRITEESIAKANIGIFEKRQKIQQLRSDGLLLRAKIREHRKIILSYLANIYSEGNVILDESGNVDLIKGMILSDQDTDFSLSDITYKTLVTQMGQKFVNEYRDLVRSYYLLQIRSKDEENQLTQLKSDLEYQNTVLVNKKAEREKLLEITQGQEALYIQYIASQQQAQEQVEQQWKNANEKYQDQLDGLLTKYNCTNAKKELLEIANCNRIRQFFLNEKQLASAELKEGTANVFDWPLKERRITAYFRDAEYYQALRSHHDAIDIAAPQGTDLMAPADGYVFYVLEPKPGGYSYLAIKHKDGLVTVYGHLSEIKVAKYDFVKKGQVFAKSGGAVGTPGAGPMTSGPHLHFEVWKNKQSVDPLRFLSLADLDYPSLPPVYQDKFITDIVEKSGTGTDMSSYKKKFNLIGSTEIDRQKYLLSTYATPDFQNWKMWIDTALDAKIDPSFMLCIGLAETTLGNHLKTSYNIGNIGNTDSGSTYSFSSPQEGLSWMTATFNNKFLGKYTKLSELSRWGNTEGPIYASSNSNWHSNTIRCLSALKGEFVPDDYAFRLQ